MQRFVLSVCQNLIRAKVFYSEGKLFAESLVRLLQPNKTLINIVMATNKEIRRLKIKFRIRKNISGTSERPRMTVFRSNRQIYAQIINDLTGKTLVSASSIRFDNKTKIEQAKEVGALMAEKALSIGIEQVVFDRNGYLYHGRVKSLADGAREKGLKF